MNKLSAEHKEKIAISMRGRTVKNGGIPPRRAICDRCGTVVRYRETCLDCGKKICPNCRQTDGTRMTDRPVNYLYVCRHE